MENQMKIQETGAYKDLCRDYAFNSFYDYVLLWFLKLSKVLLDGFILFS